MAPIGGVLNSCQGTWRYNLWKWCFCGQTDFSSRLPSQPSQDGLHHQDVASQQYVRNLTEFSAFSVYSNGEVCISILHPPGEDPNHYESSSERWSPVQSVEKILLSVVSMLAEPNCESPANIEASVCCTAQFKDWHPKVMYRDNRKMYEERVRQLVIETLGLWTVASRLKRLGCL